jgi:hypothetical protein
VDPKKRLIKTDTLKVAQQGDGLQSTVLLKQGKKVRLAITFKGIGHRAPVNDLALRRRCRVGIETPRSPLAEPGTGGRGALTVGLQVWRSVMYTLNCWSVRGL